ncbi:MAG: ParB/RepB/Spo0J family partition protein [bacterium]|jgi:ParB family chromosome partitioning protein
MSQGDKQNISESFLKVEYQNFRVFLNEPLKNKDIELKVVDVDQLIIPPIQRELSESLVEKLKESIQEIGFIDPIDVVLNKEGKYEVINGQHRLQAAILLNLTKIPVFVFPYEYRDYVLLLNIEKIPSLKDKAHQAFSIFNEYLQNNPNLKEYLLDKKIEEAYYITLGIIIDKYQDKKFPGYAFERILKKVDYFLDLELKDAIIEREKRVNILKQAKDILNQKYEELGISNSLVKQAIISKAFQNIYGRNVRNISDDFYALFDKLIKEIPKVNITEEDLI